MSTETAPPVVDPRRDFAEEIRSLLRAYLPHDPPHPGTPGDALAGIAGGMARRVADATNRAPEKNFVAFLDLLGLERLAPQPARVPLVFTLAAGTALDVRVPAGTQVAAAQLEGEAEAPLFETERELVVTRTLLSGVFSRDPSLDARADHTADAAAGTPFPAFAAAEPARHALLLDGGDALGVSGPLAAVLEIGTESRSVPWPRWVAWSHRGPAGETPLDSAWDEAAGTVSFPRLPALESAVVGGHRGTWLAARLAVPLRRRGEAPAALLPAPGPGGFRRPFGPGAGAGERALLVAADVFRLAGAKVALEVALASPGEGPDDLALAWEYARAGGEWVPLEGVEDGTAGLVRDGTVTLVPPADWARTDAGEAPGYWLRARLARGGYAAGRDPVVAELRTGYDLAIPEVTGLRLRVRAAGDDVPLPAATFNAAPLELAKDFFPLGETPRFGDAFHLLVPGVADKPGAQVGLDVVLTNPADQGVAPAPAGPTPELVLAWEFWNAGTSCWDALGVSGPGAPADAPNPHAFHDGTEAFAARAPGAHRIAFTRPAGMGETVVAGVRGSWIRARVVAGAYGHEARVVQEVQRIEYKVPVSYQPEAPAPEGEGEGEGEGGADAGKTTMVAKEETRVMEIPVQRLEPAVHAPPSLRSVHASVRWDAGPYPPAAVLAETDGEAAGRTAEAAAGTLVPFAPAEGERALYLAFDRPGSTRAFGEGSVTLYLGAEEPLASEGSAPRAAPPEPVVRWEYLAAYGWRPLEVEDGTALFTRRGTVVFVPPAGMARARDFGTDAFWVRARLESGDWLAPPHLRRVLLNTTWAAEGETVREEELGSATGERNLAFRAARAPVLDAVLEVREPVAPPAAEQRALEREGGPGAVRPAGEGQSGVWVRWTRVPGFHASAARDRHYTLDWESGEVRFGDGVHGMAPPAGGGNVRLAHYRVGGGTRGNRPAGNVAQLKTTVAYVDAASNPEPAAGGAEGESVATLMERGPRWLRHRGRAVAASDYEDLAMEASPAVARARAVLPRTPAEAGRVRVIVLPYGAEDRPIPSLELLERVRARLRGGCSPTVDVEAAGPEWLRVEVTAQVVPLTPADAYGLADRVAERIRAFLHPRTGAPEGAGWAPGRRPFKSELFALIEGTPGVHHLRSLHLRLVDERTGLPADRFTPDALVVCSGTHHVEVDTGDED